MEQFVLIPLSVYNSSNSPTIVTKQELPKYKPEQTPTYHKGTLKKEFNQQLSTNASPLVNKILESPRIKLSKSNTLEWNRDLDGIETGVLLKDFAQRLKRKNIPIPDIYFTSLDAASITPNLVVNSHAKGKERGAWIPFKIWTTKVAETLHARICGIWFCAQFGKSSKTLSVKGQKFLHSKASYTRFTQATRKFKRMIDFARYKKEIWFMDLAYVDKLAKDNNGVKCLLVRRDLFDRTVDAKRMKTKDSKETVKTFPKMITKKNRPKKIWVNQWTEFAGDLKKFCSTKGKEIYSTMSETKAAFAERIIGSLKNILYRYMENYGYK